MRQGSFRFAADCGYFSRSKRSISPRSTLPYIEASSAIAGEIYSTVSATACWPPSPRDTVEHRRVERPEAEFGVARLVASQHRAQAGQFGFEAGVEFAVAGPGGQLHQLQVEVVQVGDQVQRVVEVPLPLLALLPQQVGDVHIPFQIEPLLRLGEVAGR